MLLPLVHSMTLFRPFRAPQLAVLLAAGLGILVVASRGLTAWLRYQPGPVRVMSLAFVGMVVWMSLATAFGRDPVRSLVGHPFQSTGLIFWILLGVLTVAMLRTKERLPRFIVGALAVSGGVLILLTLLWLLGPRDLIQELLVPLSPEGVPLPGVGNSTQLGGIYAVITLAALSRACAPDLGSPLRRGAWVMFVLVLAGMTALCLSRVATIGLVAASAAGLLLTSRKGGPRLVLFGAAAAIALGLMGGELTLVPNLTRVQPQVLVTAGVSSASDPISSAKPPGRFSKASLSSGLGHRVSLWRIGAVIVSKHPVLGLGPANFVHGFRAVARPNDPFRKRVDPNVEEVFDAHNLFLEAATAAGVIGLLLMLVLVGSMVRGMLGSIGAGGPGMWLALASLVLLVMAMFEPLWLATTPLIFLLGAASMPTGVVAALPTPAPAKPPRQIAWPLAQVSSIALGVTLAACVIVSDHLLARGEAEWNRADLDLALRLDPACHPCLSALGKVRSWDFKRDGVGDLDWAMRPYRLAAAQHPNDSSAFLRLGGGFLFLRRPDLATVPLARAALLDPFEPIPTRALTVAYLLSGQAARAVPQAQKLVGITPDAGSFGLLAYAAETAGQESVYVDALRRSLALDPSGSSLITNLDRGAPS